MTVPISRAAKSKDGYQRSGANVCASLPYITQGGGEAGEAVSDIKHRSFPDLPQPSIVNRPTSQITSPLCSWLQSSADGFSRLSISGIGCKVMQLSVCGLIQSSICQWVQWFNRLSADGYTRLSLCQWVHLSVSRANGYTRLSLCQWVHSSVYLPMATIICLPMATIICLSADGYSLYADGYSCLSADGYSLYMPMATVVYLPMVTIIYLPMSTVVYLQVTAVVSLPASAGICPHACFPFSVSRSVVAIPTPTPLLY